MIEILLVINIILTAINLFYCFTTLEDMNLKLININEFMAAISKWTKNIK